MGRVCGPGVVQQHAMPCVPCYAPSHLTSPHRTSPYLRTRIQRIGYFGVSDIAALHCTAPQTGRQAPSKQARDTSYPPRHQQGMLAILRVSLAALAGCIPFIPPMQTDGQCSVGKVSKSWGFCSRSRSGLKEISALRRVVGGVSWIKQGLCVVPVHG